MCLMEDPPQENHNVSSDNSPIPPARPRMMMHDTGIAVDWTYEEQEILENGLARYSSDSSRTRYLKITSDLQSKNVRDVAMRCLWTSEKKKGNNKRRKENHNENKEINNMVMTSSSFPHLNTPSPPLIEENGFISELLKQNEIFLNQISENFKSLQINDNLRLFDNIIENFKKLHNYSNENVPELMRQMPPLPELRHDLLSLILSSSS